MGQMELNSQFFFRRFLLIFAFFFRGITAFRSRRFFSQKTAGNRRSSQKTAGNRRFSQKPVCPISSLSLLIPPSLSLSICYPSTPVQIPPIAGHLLSQPSTPAQQVAITPLGALFCTDMTVRYPICFRGRANGQQATKSGTGIGGVKTYRTLEGGELAPKVAPRKLGLLTPNWRFSIEIL